MIRLVSQQQEERPAGSGYTVTRVATELGMSRTEFRNWLVRVNRRLQRAGRSCVVAPRVGRGNRFTPDQLERLRQLRDEFEDGYAGRCPLPDDGLIDELAIDIAIRGTRVVDLTAPERRLAAARMYARGYPMNRIAAHLGVSLTVAQRLLAEATDVEEVSHAA